MIDYIEIKKHVKIVKESREKLLKVKCPEEYKKLQDIIEKNRIAILKIFNPE